MTDIKKRIKKLIDVKIESIDKEIKNLNKETTDLEELYDDIKSDINKLIYVSDSKLKYITDKLNDKDLYKELITIKKILTTNKDYSSSLRLFKKNKDAYKEFIDKLKELIKEEKSSNEEIQELEKEKERTNEILSSIDNDNFEINKELIELLEEMIDIDIDSLPEDLIIDLISLEEDKYHNKRISTKKKTHKQLSNEELTDIFKKYDYDFNSIDEEYKSYLRKFGVVENIEEVFNALIDNDYPHINNDFILTSLLLGSSAKTINTVTIFSKENHLIQNSLLDISGVLLNEHNNINDNSTLSYLLNGSSIDFMRNVMTLKNEGLSINYIFQNCKAILTMPNDLLKYNIDLFYKYGFSFDYKRRGIIDPSPAALLSTNFASVADAFIEIHPDGLKYLVDNLSNLRTVSNPTGILFYNIYYSYKHYNEDRPNDPENGPFRKVLEENNENYQLKAIITRNKPDYRTTPYKGITEDNKRKKTNTIEFDIKGKKQFDKIINKNKYQSINNSIFNNSYILTLNKYIDEESPLIYNFKGTRISRLKVLRIYSTLINNDIEEDINTLMYAITYNSIMDKDSYNNILNIVEKELR